jgi:hypothetical protein
VKRIIAIGALALVAGCGGTNGGVSVGTDATATTAADVSSADTVTVENFDDMPAQCIDLLTEFLKKIEPTVVDIKWDEVTVADFNAFGQQFKAESDSFDTRTAAAGCDKYNLSGSDGVQFQQMTELAAVEAPGTIEFLTFLSSLSSDATATAASIPTDCAGTIAAIEPFLGEGKSVKDVTMTQLTVVGQLMSAVQTNCSEEDASAFYARDDVTAFVAD